MSSLAMIRVALAALGLLLCGCAGTTTSKLPSFDAAMAAAQPESPKKPRLFESAQVSDRAVQEMVPYAVLARRLRGSSDGRARYMWACSLSLMPDAVVFVGGQASTTVSPGAPVFFGTAFVFSSTWHNGSAVVLREAPACLPFTYRGETLMVIELDQTARDAGMLEGDTVASIDGIPLSLKESPWASPLHLKRMTWQSGDKIRVSLIRPGKGMFDIDVILVPNPRRYLEEQDHFSLTDVEDPIVTRDYDGRVVGWMLPPPPPDTRYHL